MRRALLLVVVAAVITTIALVAILTRQEGAEFENRKGNAVLEVVNESGEPVLGATVSYTQVNHDFLFGVGQTHPNGRYPLSIYQQLRAAGLNYALPWLSWGHIESIQGQYDWSFVDYLYMPEEVHDLGFTLNGHCLIWFYDEYSNLPGYLLSLSFDDLKQAVSQHVENVVSHYENSISYWTVNEPMMQNALGLTSDEWVEIIRTVVQAVRAADPDGRVMVNLWPVPILGSGYSPTDFVNTLIQNNVDFDVIGLELYPYSVPLDSNGYPELSWVSDLLDNFGAFGKPVFLSEISVPNEPSEEAQAKWLHDVYNMAFDKSFMGGISWHYIVDDPFLPGGGLFENDYTPRMAYQTLQGLLGSWTTNGSGMTDAQGIVRFSGFAGEYNIDISAGGYGTETAMIHIPEQRENSLTITLRSVH